MSPCTPGQPFRFAGSPSTAKTALRLLSRPAGARPYGAQIVPENVKLPDLDAERNRRKSDATADRKVTVLAVDDDGSYLGYLEHILKRAGYGVLTAPSAAAAFDILHQQRVDLLLVDLQMPVMDGIEMVQKLREDEELRSLYSILLTASGHLQTKLRALDSGLDDYLPKQSSETEILAKLRSAARRLDLERRLHLENEELQTLALTDELTGIANRRSLFRAADKMLASGRPVAAILFDLNHFKQVNDTHGHVAGDRILADVGAVCRNNTRLGDLVGRYGGDEFLMLIRDATVDDARIICRRLEGEICQLRWTIRGTTFGTSACFGVAGTDDGPHDTFQDILNRCDEEMYRSKEVGSC
jgi:two-component system cell cycle response regulator